MKIKIFKHSYHRNGISGNGFDVFIFTTEGDPTTLGKRMLGIVFEEPGSVAVFDLDELNKAKIEFGYNSWRGDHFEPELRKYLKLQEALRRLK